ncbi:MAG: pyridoxal phosphate-dependent aminotransferase [Candidatus Omnitrophica bacterium]|nr:pyridoxal phosphate-dependent aminotransferase [Candidatus Omnitrophota bacterium]
MMAQGQAVVNFAGGEPDFDTPEYIKKAAIKAIEEGFTKYTPATGFPLLKEAISRKFLRDNKLCYDPTQIVVNCGAKHSIYSIVQALCEKGDEVIIPSPYWVSYPEMVALAQAKTRFVNTDPGNNFKLEPKALKRNITAKTKLLILNSPANPTGSVYSKKELQEIIDTVLKHKLYIISDEIYEKLVYDGKKHVSCASLDKSIFARTIVVNGVSKSFAMTGWRIGYLACADKEIIKAIGNLQSHSTSNPCSISQKAALVAISSAKDALMQKMVKTFEDRRNCMMEGLDRAGLSYIKPEGAFYIFCNIKNTGLDSVSFSEKLLTKKEVAVIPGVAFGRDDYVRLSFATNAEKIVEGTKRIHKFLNTL